MLALGVLLACATPAGARQQTKTYRYGPIVLGAYQVQRDTSFPTPPRRDGFITAMNAQAVDASGRPLPLGEVMLHHVLFSNEGRSEGDRRDASCPDIPRQRFFGRGEEGRALSLPRGYGYPIRKRDRWRMNWMLMNHTSQRRTAYIQYTVTVDDARKRSVTPVWLDVARCRRGSIFSVPGTGRRGSVYRKSIDWRPPFDGYIVEAGAHLHGGALGMTLTQPSCGGRTLVRSRPLYGLRDDPLYTTVPMLHEPGPLRTSTSRSIAGIPVQRGDRLRATALYDGERPHPAVMAMLHLYVARAPAPIPRCARVPAVLEDTASGFPGRARPPRVAVPLYGLTSRGRIRRIARPRGRMASVRGSTTIDVRRFAYRFPNLSVPLGATLRWRFLDREPHNVTLANGPLGFASLNLARGRTFSQRLTRPGTYKLFCSLHPTSMQQVVRVRRR